MTVRHDDFCDAVRFRRLPCTCGEDAAQRIVDEVSAKFGEELKRIMAGEYAERLILPMPLDEQGFPA